MDPTTRFSSRVAAYVEHRPGYPAELVPKIAEVTGLQPPALVADIGSGTGISSRPFLEAGYTVIGVEPNDPMRQAGDDYLAAYPAFKSVKGTAESTALDAESVDLVVAAQAFHWFDPERTRAEWRRILRPPGWVALLWNDRQTDTSPFLVDYEQLLVKHGTDYATVNHRNIDKARIEAFFEAPTARELHFTYVQHLDYAGLKGRLDSSSYIPEAGTREYEAMIAELQELFDSHNKDGHIDIVYTTEVHLGRLSGQFVDNR
jgi:SAM-dependent methyltransferase